MTPTTFKQQNAVFEKPNDMTEDQCGSLPAFKGDAYGRPIILSCWKLSDDEIEQIKHTGRIWLSVTGNIMPPVSLFTENPF